MYHDVPELYSSISGIAVRLSLSALCANSIILSVLLSLASSKTSMAAQLLRFLSSSRLLYDE